MSMKTYKMEYTCCNCGTKHIADVEFGQEARHGNKECPYCGLTYWFDFSYQKPKDNLLEVVDNQGNAYIKRVSE